MHKYQIGQPNKLNNQLTLRNEANDWKNIIVIISKRLHNDSLKTAIPCNELYTVKILGAAN